MLALIGGTLGFPVDETSCLEERRASTRWGEPSAPLRRYGYDGGAFWYLNRHGGEPRYAPHAIPARANISALADAGVTRILGLATVGGIGPGLEPGVLSVPHQLIDYSGHPEQSFRDPWCEVTEHIEFAAPLDGDMRQSLIGAAARVQVPLCDSGVVGCTRGPRLETAAEIARLARDGCDLVNMTLIPEAPLARELGLAYASLALVVNRAAGLSPLPDIGAVLDRALPTLERLLLAWLSQELADE